MKTHEIPKLLFDEMLTGLVHWLRAAGYDAEALPPGMKPRKMIEYVRGLDAVIVTRNEHLTHVRGQRECVIWLHGNDAHTCLQELGKRLKLDWTLAPFTRCLLCNTPLVASEPTPDVPEAVRKSCTEYRACPTCHRVYWEGSHTDRMLAYLHSLK